MFFQIHHEQHKNPLTKQDLDKENQIKQPRLFKNP